MKLPLLEKLVTHFGFASFRPGQEEVISKILEGKDILAVMPTGSGKSLCYQLSSHLLEGTTLVISPLISLMKDQVDSIREYNLMKVTSINSSIPLQEQESRMKGLLQGDYKMVYVAPERFRSRPFMEAISKIKTSLFVIDEAHCISQWGHDFRPDYLALKNVLPQLNHPRVLALTATATPRVQKDIKEQLNLKKAETILTGFNRPNLFFEVLNTFDERAKLRELKKWLEKNKEIGIVYTGTRREAEEVAQFIKEEIKIPVGFYHAGLEREERERIQNAFMKEEIRVVCATIAFGLGIDKPNIRFVIHYNLPSSLENYYQEAGRSGRDGFNADCSLFYSPEDRSLQEWFIENNSITPEEIRQVYETLIGLKQEGVQSGQGGEPLHEISPVELEFKTGLRETKIRVSLQELERLEVLERLPDKNQNFIIRFRKTFKHSSSLPLDVKYLAQQRRVKVERLNRLIQYAEISVCRRRFILDYFGDHPISQSIRCCDNCEKSRKYRMTGIKPDLVREVGKKDLSLRILKLLNQAESPLRKQKILQNLVGRRRERIKTTSYFTQKGVEGILSEMIEKGVIKQIGRGRLSVLRLTSKGKEEIQKELTEEERTLPLKEEVVERFLTRPRPQSLKGQFNEGYALAVNSRYTGFEWKRTEIGELTFRYKYGLEKELVGELADRMALFILNHPPFDQSDILLPVPSSIKDRPYDPVPLLTEVVGKKVKIPARMDILEKVRPTQPQKDLTTEKEKETNVRGAFQVSQKEAVKGKRVLIIEDLYDSGATLNELTRILKGAGTEKVYVLALTKTLQAEKY